MCLMMGHYGFAAKYVWHTGVRFSNGPLNMLNLKKLK